MTCMAEQCPSAIMHIPPVASLTVAVVWICWFQTAVRTGVLALWLLGVITRVIPLRILGAECAVSAKCSFANIILSNEAKNIGYYARCAISP